MKKIHKVFHWLIPENVYRVPINILLVKEHDAGIEWVRKNYADKGDDLSFIKKAGGHYYSKRSRTDVVVWISDENDLPCLAHELIHYAVDTLENRGVPTDEKTSEALTYLHQSVFISCLLALGHKKYAGKCVK